MGFDVSDKGNVAVCFSISGGGNICYKRDGKFAVDRLIDCSVKSNTELTLIKARSSICAAKSGWIKIIRLR